MTEVKEPCGTPNSTNQSVSSSSMVPGIPKPPFDPPRRRSSLAFSKILSSPHLQETVEDSQRCYSDPVLQTPASAQSNISRKRVIKPPFHASTVSPHHMAQLQESLQNAKNSLHLDMRFAASPLGSIDAHLPQQYKFTNEANSEFNDKQQPVMVSAKNWRYSAIPQFLATMHRDVREPLPASSPSLPTDQPLDPVVLDEEEDSLEPTSSGFVTPNDEFEEDMFTCLPPLPPSSPPPSVDTAEDALCLQEPMNGLKVDGTDGSDDDMSVEGFPDPSLFPQRSRYLADSPIFLSRTARAAAESARAKRGFIGNPFHSISAESASNSTVCPEPVRYQVKSCPSASLRQPFGLGVCPDPALHARALIPASMVAQEFTPTSSASRTVHHARPYIQEQHLLMPGPRVNADGSPMPFSRQRAQPMLASTPHVPYQSYQAASYQFINHNSRLYNPRQASMFKNALGDIQGDTRRVQQVPHLTEQAFSELYSFSTAAAKITGESIAPDSRIRDSYRTDTLTPSVHPPQRFKKIGAGVSLGQRGSDRFNGPFPQQLRTPSCAVRSGGKFRYEDMADVESQSSPSGPSADLTSVYQLRKRRRSPRAYTPDFYIAANEVTESTSDIKSNVITTDEANRAAVRVNTFGSRTPEVLCREQDVVKRLSPQVSIWRKDLRRVPLARKKRRPSYWDNDLEEVRMSPAARGGIESSPTMSKRSMMAQVEHMTLSSVSLSLHEDSCGVGDEDEGEEDHGNIDDAQDWPESLKTRCEGGAETKHTDSHEAN